MVKKISQLWAGPISGHEKGRGEVTLRVPGVGRIGSPVGRVVVAARWLGVDPGRGREGSSTFLAGEDTIT